MKRWLLAAAFLVGVVGLTRAEYVILIANLGLVKEAQGAGPMIPGVPGGIPGAGGEGGAGFQNPMGQPGAANPMQPIGPFPGGFPGPMPPMGQGGQPGAARPGGVGPEGPGGIMAPGIGRGGPGGEGGEGGFFGGEVDLDLDDTPMFVMAVVEARGIFSLNNALYLANGYPTLLNHKWGKTALIQSQRIRIFPMVKNQRALVPSPAKLFDLENRKIQRDKETKTAAPEALLELADWCLAHGLVTQYTKVMDELVQSHKAHAAAVAYAKIKADLAKPVIDSPMVRTWQQKLYDGFKVQSKGHYTLLHQSRSNEAKDVLSRLDRLEESLKTFYYWFAMKGHALPVPAERLIAVQITLKDEFDRNHQIFDGTALVSDGFHARRDNLVVFSASRVDAGYSALRELLKPVIGTADPDALLQGKGDYYAQTAQLFLRAMEADAELASVSHEGARQLLAGANLLPRNVAAPEWVQFGMGSFFESPRGNPWLAVGAPSNSLGAPLVPVDHDNYLLHYQAWSKRKPNPKDKDKPETPVQILEKVVTDRYFREATEPGKEKRLTPPIKARTYAWALTYYLARERLDGLLRYLKELHKLPRDLEFDDEVLMDTFARAFGLVDTQTGKVNREALRTFAGEWNNAINRLTPDVAEVIDIVKKSQQQPLQPVPVPAPPPGFDPNNPTGGAVPGSGS